MWTTQSIAEGKDTGDSGEERKGHEGGGGGEDDWREEEGYGDGRALIYRQSVK